MASVTRTVELNIVADAQQAIGQLRQLGMETDSVTGQASFNAEKFNDTVRNSIGVLGDVDTAFQTLGSTLGITQLQVVGDVFAIGEAFGQLVGVAPALLQNFSKLANTLGTSTMALGAFGIAMAGVGIAFAAVTASAQQASQALTQEAQADVAGLEARIQAQNMSAEQRAKIAADSAERITGLEEIIAEKRAHNEAIYQANVENSGKLAADVSKQFGGMAQVSEEYISSLEAQVTAEKERLSAFEEVGTATEEVTKTFEMAPPAIQKTSTALMEFERDIEKTATNITETTKRFSSRGGGRALSGAEAREAQANVRARARALYTGVAQATDQFTDEQINQLKQDHERRLQEQADFLTRQAQIEDDFRRGRSQAIRDFNVAGFLGAETRRQDALAQLQAPSIVVNANVGELVTPTQLDSQVTAITSGISNALVALPGA